MSKVIEEQDGGAWVGDLNEDQRWQVADHFGLLAWGAGRHVHRAECERLEAALGEADVSVTTQYFLPGRNDDLLRELGFNPRLIAKATDEDTRGPWCCDLRFELRDEQPPPRNVSGRGIDRKAAVLSAVWAAFSAGEFAREEASG